MVRMTARVDGLAKLRGETTKVRNRIDRGDLNVAAVLPFFDHVASKFDAEGPGWAPLSPMRIKRRGSEHPILDHHGDLRRTATSWVEDAKGPKVAMHVSGGSDAKTWELSGEKVENQFGSTTTWALGPVVNLSKFKNTRRHLPARPFWPMESSEFGGVIDNMMKPLELFADGWADGSLAAFDADLKQAKAKKRTR